MERSAMRRHGPERDPGPNSAELLRRMGEGARVRPIVPAEGNSTEAATGAASAASAALPGPEPRRPEQAAVDPVGGVSAVPATAEPEGPIADEPGLAAPPSTVDIVGDYLAFRLDDPSLLVPHRLEAAIGVVLARLERSEPEDEPTRQARTLLRSTFDNLRTLSEVTNALVDG